MTGNDIFQQYEMVRDIALASGIQSSRIHNHGTDTELQYIIVECHDLLKLLMYYDGEWTIEYHYPKGINHNHIMDNNHFEFINALFKGEIYLLIDKRKFRPTIFEFRFVFLKDIANYFEKYKKKRNVMLFSTQKIVIDNYNRNKHRF